LGEEEEESMILAYVMSRLIIYEERGFTGFLKFIEKNILIIWIKRTKISSCAVKLKPLAYAIIKYTLVLKI
jgi:hypothetical protein